MVVFFNPWLNYSIMCHINQAQYPDYYENPYNNSITVCVVVLLCPSFNQEMTSYVVDNVQTYISHTI